MAFLQKMQLRATFPSKLFIICSIATIIFIIIIIIIIITLIIIIIIIISIIKANFSHRHQV